MGKEILAFGDVEIEKKKAIIVLFFRRCENGQTKWTYFLIYNGKLLEKNNIIWDKISADIKKEIDRDGVTSLLY